MNGIEAAFEGRIGKVGELRTSQSGKPWCSISVVVGKDDDSTWLNVAVFGEQAETVAGLEKGTRIYVEGRLSLDTWQDREGNTKTGLKVAAFKVVPLGQIGRRKPARASEKGQERQEAGDTASAQRDWQRPPSAPSKPAVGYGGYGPDTEIPF